MTIICQVIENYVAVETEWYIGGLYVISYVSFNHGLGISTKIIQLMYGW